MFTRLLIVGTFIALVFLDIPRLIKEKQIKEVVVVSIILVLGLSVALMVSFGIRFPLIQLPQI